MLESLKMPTSAALNEPVLGTSHRSAARTVPVLVTEPAARVRSHVRVQDQGAKETAGGIKFDY